MNIVILKHHLSLDRKNQFSSAGMTGEIIADRENSKASYIEGHEIWIGLYANNFSSSVISTFLTGLAPDGSLRVFGVR